MTNEHLRPLLDDARGKLLKGGRVRGVVVGDIVRRLVSRTIAQQLATTVEKAIAPLPIRVEHPSRV